MNPDAPDRSGIPQSVTVTTGSRLHFGLLTHRPPSGREFGGLGTMIDAPGWRITVSAADHPATAAVTAVRNGPGVCIQVSRTAAAECPDTAERIRGVLDRWFRSARRDDAVPSGLTVDVERAIPGHRGLGSGTQLGLALGRALSLLGGEDSVSAATLAERTGRGLRSAVGTWGFELGGMILDGGKRPGQTVGTCVSRLPFPPDWRFLLIAPADGHGLSGSEEVAAFERLQGMPRALTERLCRIALMELLPAIADADPDAASKALTEYGQVSGEYFASVQGGIYADDRMAGIGRRITRRGHGFLQTSWGPTCAALCTGDEDIAELTRDLASLTADSLILTPARPLNRGAAIRQEISTADNTSPHPDG